MKFKIEQVALCPRDPAKAIALLTEMGMAEWVHDIVVARGAVLQDPGEVNRVHENVARLAFNYQALNEAKELEVLHYTAGHNWMADDAPRVSHLGMHCTMNELQHWKDFFRRRNIKVVQEVDTQSHSNAVIAGKRWYHYCIFGTWSILGVDIKFIVRKETP